jgi:hypothetical protein
MLRAGEARRFQNSWLEPEDRPVAGRKERRYRLNHVVPVGFIGAGHRFTGNLINISSSGMLAKCTQDIEPGTALRAGIEVGNETFRAVVAARRRVPQTGIGFEFQNMSMRDRQKLRLLLMRIARSL